MAAVTEGTFKEALAEIVKQVEQEYAEKSKNWPSEMKNASDKVMGMVQEAVNIFLSGDITVIREALTSEVVKMLKTGKSGASKSLADLA